MPFAQVLRYPRDIPDRSDKTNIAPFNDSVGKEFSPTTPHISFQLAAWCDSL